MPKRWHSASSEAACPGSLRRVMVIVSTTRPREIGGKPRLPNSALRKPTSNSALWMTSVASAMKSTNSPAICAKTGLPLSLSAVMPCTATASAGMSRSGSM